MDSINTSTAVSSMFCFFNLNHISYITSFSPHVSVSQTNKPSVRRSVVQLLKQRENPIYITGYFLLAVH